MKDNKNSKELSREQLRLTFRKGLFGQQRDHRTQFAQKQHPRFLFSRLKTDHSFEETRHILRDYSSPNSPFYRFAYGQPIVKDYSLLKLAPVLPEGQSWEEEMQWMLQSVLIFSDVINQQLSFKHDFESAFTRSDFSAASKCLQMVETTSVSFWSLENRLLLYEYAEGLEKNKGLLSSFNKVNTDLISRLIIDLASERVERKMSAVRYEQKVAATSRTLTDHGLQSIASFYRFRAGVHMGPSDFSPKDILYWEWNAPIIDRYLAVLSVAQRLSVVNISARPFIYKLLLTLNNKISDPALSNLLLFCDPADSLNAWMRSGFSYLTILDDYTQGHYERVTDTAATFLALHPHSFEVHELAAKAKIHLKRIGSLSTDRPTKPMCESLQDLLVCIYGKCGTYLEAHRQLAKLVYVLRHFTISRGITALIAEEQQRGDIQECRAIAELNSHFVNPRFVDIFRDLTASLAILTGLETVIPKSITVCFWRDLYRLWQTKQCVPMPSSIPVSRRLYYSALVFQKLNFHGEAVSLLQEAASDPTVLENHYSYGNIVQALLASFIATGRLSEAVSLVVNAYFVCEWLFVNLPVETLLGRIATETDTALHGKIEIPMVSYLNRANTRLIHAAYDTFMNSHGFKRPTEILPVASMFPQRDLMFFLARVCVPEILSHSVHFENSADLQQERVAICQHLIKVSADKAPFTEEISRITQALLIKRAVREVEESKIFVDIGALKTAAELTLRESFERYLEIRRFTNEADFVFLQTDATILGLKRIGSAEDGERLYLLAHPSFLLFRELFLEIRHRFIGSSEYGLDSYLSVRIRHGTLLGQLRRAFEAHHLVTRKDQTSQRYLLNPFWAADTEEDGRAIQNVLSVLSQKVDEISSRISGEWIQTTTEKNVKIGALFDYSYSDLDLHRLHTDTFADIISYESFLDTALTELWNETQLHLDEIRFKLQREATSDFIRILNECHEAVRKLPNRPRTMDLTKAIASCRTDVQHELDHVAKWFTISERKFTTFTIKHLFQSALEIFNTTYPLSNLRPELDIQTEASFQGTYLPGFVDILMVIFTNALTHSGIRSGDVEMVMCVRSDENTLSIAIRNAVLNQEISERAVFRVAQVSAQFKAPDALEIVRLEGGSGFAKIYKLLKFDLGRRDYRVEGRSVDRGVPGFEIVLTMETDGLL